MATSLAKLFVYVTNLAIDLRLFDDPTQPTLTNATGDSPWTADVKVHTISRIPAFIPPIPGLSKPCWRCLESESFYRKSIGPRATWLPAGELRAASVTLIM